MSSASNRVAANLKKLMISKGISQLELAKVTGLTGATINAFCNGRGKVVAHSLELMAEALGTTTEELISGDHVATGSPPGLDEIVRAFEAAAQSLTQKTRANDPAAQKSLDQILELLAPLDPASMKKALIVAHSIREQFDSETTKTQKKSKKA